MNKILFIFWLALILLLPLNLVYSAPGDTADKHVKVSWDANTEDDLLGYRIYLAKELLMEVPDPLATSINIVVEGLVNGDNVFNMTAYDTSGNESLFSEDAILPYDGTSPNVPSNVIVQETPHTRVTIESWE